MSSNLTVPTPAIRESEALAQLIRRLEEMFQLDRGDLDFGIYRIMNFRRDEILRFLRSELPVRAEEAVRAAGIGDGAAALRRELDKAIAGAREAGFDPDASPRVRELRAEIARAGNTAPDALLDQIWTALDRFFGRYYDEGDFIAQRRGRDGAYLIPYEGEEVTLHWANKDQYYVKSSESFANYVFRLEDGRAVRFRTVVADTERDNNKEAKGKNRRFRLAEDRPLAEEDGDLIVRFTYRADEDDKRRQDALNAETAEAVLALPQAADWASGLAAPAPTDRDNKRRLIDKHLAAFTAKNSFDYFIHKDLKHFLTRELDLFLDREVLNRRALNEARRANRMEQIAAELAKAEAVERIATEVIEFLAQIEEFQKRLWLKKKFVLDTQWCLTLDRIDAKFYPEIAASEAQRREWVELFAIDGIGADRLGEVAYSEPLTEAFLHANPFLVLDTKHFDEDFKARLLASIDDLDDQMDGLLVHSENFQGLLSISSKMDGKIQCVAIDPPYNTGDDGFIYKDAYKTSSWMTFTHERAVILQRLIANSGSIWVSIDDNEYANLWHVASEVFGRQNYLCSFVWKRRSASGMSARPLSLDHEYILAFSKDEKATSLHGLAKSQEDYPYFDEKKQLWYASTDLTIGMSSEQRPNQFFSITNPRTGRVFDANPNRVWRFFPETMNDVIKADLVIWPDEADGRLERPRYKTYFDPENNKPKPLSSWIETASTNDREIESDESDYMVSVIKSGMNQEGGRIIEKIFGNKSFAYPKPVSLLRGVVRATTRDKDIVLDCFAGSGTTVHAVIDLNREDKQCRRYVAIESAAHFDDVLIPRVKKVIAARKWESGKPVSRDGVSHAFKYIRLESYEDALENLALEERPKALESLFSDKDRQAGPGRMSELRIRYMLSRMLATEAKGASLLDLDGFRDPTGYTLTVLRDGVETPVRVDLVETFSWLIGMTVKRLSAPRRYRSAFVHDRHGRLVWPRRADGRIDRAGFRADPDGPHWFRLVEGTLPGGEQAVVIWRSLTGDAETDNLALDAFAEIAGLNARDSEVRVVWVNGDNNLQNLRLAASAGEDGEPQEADAEAPPIAVKVRLIEEDFQRLMFADTDTTGIL